MSMGTDIRLESKATDTKIGLNNHEMQTSLCSLSVVSCCNSSIVFHFNWQFCSLVHLISKCKLIKYVQCLLKCFSRNILPSYNHLIHAEGILLSLGNIQICETCKIGKKRHF